MPYQFCTRSHEIHCGHRVFGHQGKCQHLHGHAYVFEITCSAPELDDLGMVIDFGVIKSEICEWLEKQWDHRMLIWSKDPILPALRACDTTVVAVPFNPTAENLAKHMVEKLGPDLLGDTGVKVVQCTVRETSKCSATFSL